MLMVLGAIAADFTAKKVGNAAKVNFEKVADSFELIMFTTSICAYCAIFEKEIGEAYDSHELTKKAPLIRINLDEYGTGPYHLTKPLRYAPTFILMNNGKEVGRLTGHMDQFIFLTFVRDNVYTFKQLADQR